MRLPSTICLHLALLLSSAGLSTTALAAPGDWRVVETELDVSEDALADGVSFQVERTFDVRAPFRLVPAGTARYPVWWIRVASAPSDLDVRVSRSVVTVSGESPTAGTVVLSLPVRELRIDVDVDFAPRCDGDFRQIVGKDQRDVLLQPADLCIDVEGDSLEVTDVTAADGSELKVSYSEDGSATVHMPSGEGSQEIAYKVGDGDNIGHGEFTITSRDEFYFLRGAPTAETTGTLAGLAAEASTKDDPLKAVDVELVDPDEQVEFAACCGGFTLSFPDVDLALQAPVLEGEFVDADDTPVYVTWDIVYNELPECTDTKSDAKAGTTTVTLPLSSACKDPEGDTVTVEAVKVDGKEVDYKVDAKTGDLAVSLPRAYKAGESSKVEAQVSDGVKEGEPLTGPILFTITFRDDF